MSTFNIETRRLTRRGRNAGFYTSYTRYCIVPMINNEKRIPLLDAKNQVRYFETYESAKTAAKVWQKGVAA